MRYIKLAFTLLVLLGLGAAPARANLTIIPTFDSTILSDPNSATIQTTINNTIAVYQATFTNPITVSILFHEDQTIGLGASFFYTNFFSYDTYRNALITTKGSNAGDVLLNLPAGGNPVPGNSNAGVAPTTAQARAIGLTAPPQAVIGGVAYDGEVSLKTSITNLSRSGTQDPNKYDLVSITSHEIDEVLGVFSGLNGLANHTGTASVSNVYGMDFYRYSAPGVRSFTTDANAQSYFSVDGGVTPLIYFNQRADGDFQDWASHGESYASNTFQVQDAFAFQGATANLGPNELKALQDVGYNIAPAPEPAQCADLGCVAFSVFGLLLRSRRRHAGKMTA